MKKDQIGLRDVGLLILRATSGGLLAGHGAQKLFGWFGGYGLKGTAGWLESLGMRPGKPWAVIAGASELGGGALMLLGALNPFGVLGTIGSMSMATAKVHWGKPIWVTSGGAELPVINMAAALAIGLVRPGKLSVDHALGLKLPRRLILFPGLLLTAAAVGAGVIVSNRPQPQPEEQIQPQAQPEMERSEAVQVPERPIFDHEEPREPQPEMEPERVYGAELRAGESADQPA